MCVRFGRCWHYEFFFIFSLGIGKNFSKNFTELPEYGELEFVHKGWSLRLFSGMDIFFWKKSFLPTTTFIWHYISIYLIWQTLLWEKKNNLISWIQLAGKYITCRQLHFWTVFSMNNIFSKFFFMLLAEKKS